MLISSLVRYLALYSQRSGPELGPYAAPESALFLAGSSYSAYSSGLGPNLLGGTQRLQLLDAPAPRSRPSTTCAAPIAWSPDRVEALGNKPLRLPMPPGYVPIQLIARETQQSAFRTMQPNWKNGAWFVDLPSDLCGTISQAKATLAIEFASEGPPYLPQEVKDSSDFHVYAHLSWYPYSTLSYEFPYFSELGGEKCARLLAGYFAENVEISKFHPRVGLELLPVDWQWAEMSGEYRGAERDRGLTLAAMIRDSCHHPARTVHGDDPDQATTIWVEIYDRLEEGWLPLASGVHIDDTKKFADFSPGQQSPGLYRRLDAQDRLRVLSSKLGIDNLDDHEDWVVGIPSGRLVRAVHATLELCYELPEVSDEISKTLKTFLLGCFGRLSDPSYTLRYQYHLQAALEAAITQGSSEADLLRVIQQVSKDSFRAFDKW